MTATSPPIEPAALAPRRARRWPLWPVVLILLLAAAARIHGAAGRPVWTDEGFVAWATGDPDLGEVFDRVETWDRHPPLYVFTVATWRQVAGDSRIALRWWAIAAGLLATAVVYRTGADWLGHGAARYAALVFAVLEMAVYYGQEIRDYGWLVLAVGLMSFFFLRCLRRPRPLLLAGYVLSITFMLYTVYLGLLALAVQGIIWLAWRAPWRAKLRLAAAWIASVILFVPWLVVLLRQYDRGYNSVSQGISDFPGSYETALDTLRPVIELVLGSQLALTGGLFLLGAWGLSGWTLARGGAPSIPERSRLAGLYLVLASGGLFAFMLVANLWIGLVAARTLAYLTPALALVCGWGLWLIRPGARALFAGLLAILALASDPVIQPRMDYDVAARALAAQASPGDLVILETGWDDNAFEYELSLALPDDVQTIRTLPWTGDPGRAVPVVPQVEDAVRAHRRVWVVQWLQPSQVIPWLETGDDGYRVALAQATPTGAQYAVAYPQHPTIYAALFERPDLAGDPLVYGDVLALGDALLPESIRAGERLHVDLWWAALAPPALDYSVGVFLLDAGGRVVAEHNGPPGNAPTTAWTVGEFAFDRHTLALPGDLAPGAYDVMVNAYWYGDLEPLRVDGDDAAVVGQVTVRAR